VLLNAAFAPLAEREKRQVVRRWLNALVKGGPQFFDEISGAVAWEDALLQATPIVFAERRDGAQTCRIGNVVGDEPKGGIGHEWENLVGNIESEGLLTSLRRAKGPVRGVVFGSAKSAAHVVHLGPDKPAGQFEASGRLVLGGILPEAHIDGGRMATVKAALHLAVRR
jgi:hypothetical protein